MKIPGDSHENFVTIFQKRYLKLNLSKINIGIHRDYVKKIQNNNQKLSLRVYL